MTKELTYFKPHEFHCPDGSFECMDWDFIYRLDRARHYAGVPFVITSAFRTPEKNEEVGGSPTSSHLKGLAVDISCTNSVHRYEIVRRLLGAGFTRIGIGEDFIHVDADPAKHQGVIWLYD